MMGFLTAEMAVLFTTPVTIVLILLEIFVSIRHNRGYYKSKDTKENLVLGAAYVVIDLVSYSAGLFVLGLFHYYGFHYFSHLEHTFLYWFSLLLVEDFTYWFMHFLDHRVRILWSGHIHHHSSKEFNFSVGIRSAVFEPIEKFIFFIPLAVIGYRPVDIVLIYILTQAWGTFVHTRTIKKLGILEFFLTTPSHHRVHHGRNINYLDKNYGMFLIIWDKIFGTFQAEKEEEAVEFGLVKNIEYRNYADVIFHEYKQMINDCRQNIPFKQKLRYVFGPPGYSHDGSRKTSKELQAELADKMAKK